MIPIPQSLFENMVRRGIIDGTGRVTPQGVVVLQHEGFGVEPAPLMPRAVQTPAPATAPAKEQHHQETAKGEKQKAGAEKR